MALTSQLTDIQVRVLGCSVEKESTTPDHYPLTLNALKNARNQKSNRNMFGDGRTGYRVTVGEPESTS